MTRLLLGLFVSSTALAVGLSVACCQSGNHACAKRLDTLLRECDLLRAGNEGLAARLMQQQFEFDRDQLRREQAEQAGLAVAAGVTE